jgi:glyoxylase-like metal-dependent hydrolase (beta-lactamase superfamily II)
MNANDNSGSPATGVTVQRFVLGPFETNCYLVRAGDDRECWIVDAGFQPEPMLDAIREQGLRPSKLVLTHAHIDHIAGIDPVREAFPDLPILIHEAERAFLEDANLNLSVMMGMPLTAPPADETMADGEELTIGGESWRVIFTPGHSPGGVTLYHEPSRQALVGDTLFFGSIGRFDFPTSDEQQLYASIREKLYALPDDVQVFPGHGPPTTIGREKAGNPFVRAGD